MNTIQSLHALILINSPQLFILSSLLFLIVFLLPLYKKTTKITKKERQEDSEIHHLQQQMEDRIKNYKNPKPRSVAVLLIGPLLITSFLFATCFNGVFIVKDNGKIFSTKSNDSVTCDRTSYHTDICFMRGDIRTHPSSSSVLLLSSSNPNPSSVEEKIRPYTRKWETFIMNRISELKLRIVDPRLSSLHRCDVRHNATALFFALGGYTGNVFHAFNNGLLPLYITSQHLNRQVVFVVLDYRHWWYTKYREILSQLSDYPLVDFNNDTRTHCFPDAIVGLRFHGTLTVDPSRTEGNKTIADFRNMLDRAYGHRNPGSEAGRGKPKLVIVARDGTRAIENEGEVVGLAREVGFGVEVLRPNNTMQLSTIYASLSSCDVMMGVHGAALTHFLFMKPASLFIQVVPLGIDELAQLCFGKAAGELGIRYEDYRILPAESSLYRKYGEGDPIVRDPERVKARGWEVTKHVYLDGQNVTLDISRLRERLRRAFQSALLQRGSQT